MRRYLLLLISALIAVFIQSLCAEELPSYACPQLIVGILVYLAFFEVSVSGTFAAFGLGLIMDFSSGVFVGPWAGAFVATYGCLAVVSQRLFIESTLVSAFAAGAAALSCDVLYEVLIFEFRSGEITFIADSFGRAVATAICAPLIVAFLRLCMPRRSASSTSRTSLSSVGA